VVKKAPYFSGRIPESAIVVGERPMPAMSRQSAPFRVGAWSVDPSTGQLTRGTETRRARPLVADVLLFLATHAGEVVTKEQLVAGPWGGAAIADSALTSTIAELRELLDDQPKSPQYIETLPKRGYRLIAAVALSDPIADPISDRVPDPVSDSMLDPVSDRVTIPATATPAWRWTRRSWAIAFGLGAAFAIAVTVSIASRPRPAAPPPTPPVRPMRLTVDLPGGVRLAPSTVPRLAITADGARMAYVVRTATGPSVYTRTLEQFEAQAVAGTEDASAPFFSPDGSRVGFFAGGELRTVPVSGGAPIVLCTARVALGGSWAPDDQIVYSGAHGLGLFEVAAAGGSPRDLTTPDRSRDELSHRWPQVLPDGDHVLYTAIGRKRADAVIVSRHTGQRTVVIENAYAAMFVPPNRLLFERDERLQITTIDPERFTPTGPVRMIADDVASGAGWGAPQFTVAHGGALVYVPIDPYDSQRELVWVDRSGRATSAGAPAKSYMHPQLSPDGRQVLTWLRIPDYDVWLFDVASRALTRIVTGVPARRAAWSPDGRRMIFDGPSPDNPVTLYDADVSGGRARRLRSVRYSQYAGAWTADGHAIAYLDLKQTSGFDIMTAADEPDAPATALLNGPANETAPAFSPDGRWLAYVSDVTGREEVYLRPHPAGGTAVQVSTSGGREPVWSARGDELFYRQGQTMWAARVTGTSTPRVSDAVALFTGEYDQRPSFHPSYDVAPDGRFLMIRGIAPPTTDTRIAVLLRWDVP
jgi:DNA-binding winged helix-turn-helix (wHTH) protein/Tol biopolymer transport system component